MTVIKIRSIQGMRGYKNLVAIVPDDALRPCKSSVNYDADSADKI